jgi:hypothetical protein
MESSGDEPGGARLLERLGELAGARGTAYQFYDHTLFGSPLSLLWRGKPYSYERHEPQMVERRRELEEHGDRYDALVLTEGVPIAGSSEREFSAHYLRRFMCTFLRGNPDGRVYLFESWVHYQASNQASWAETTLPSVWRWEEKLEADRAIWDQIADEAVAGSGVAPPDDPGLGTLDDPCNPRYPIYILPVATVMRAVSTRLQEPHGWIYQEGPLEMYHFFLNPYTEWPEDWPLASPISAEETFAALEGLPLRFPERDWDDIHPSDLGVYLTTLTCYATLYQDSPVGLPPPPGMPRETAEALQSLVWDTIRKDPRAGVR